MVKQKKVRMRGKLKLSRWFQELNVGDRVSILRETSVQPKFPKRLQGRTGVVENKKGKVYIIKILDQNKEKRFLIEPIHLKKITTKKKLEVKNDKK